MVRWLHPGFENLWQLGFLSLLLLFISSLFAWQHINAAYCLNRLKHNHGLLTELLRTQLELDSEVKKNTSSTDFHKASNFFRQRHLAELNRVLNQRLPRRPGWLSAIVAAFVAQALLAGAAYWSEGSSLAFRSQVMPSPPHADSLRMLFPAYLKRPPEHYQRLPDSLSTPRGSRLEMIWENQPESSEVSYFEIPSGKKPLQWTHYGERTMASLTPDHSGVLGITWENRKIPWEVLLDAFPALQVNWPDMKPIFDTSRIPVNVYAEDDHAMHQVVLYYRTENNRESHREILQSYEAHHKVYNENYEWDLSMTPLRAGNRVSAWIEASDRNTLHGPSVSKSSAFHFQVESRLEYHEAILERFRKLSVDMGILMINLDLKSLENTTERENRILAELKIIQMDMVHDSLLSDPLKAFPKKLEAQLRFYQQQRINAGKP